jgi:hypothetical protein
MFTDEAYAVVVRFASKGTYSVESHASVSGHNCRSARWAHRFRPFATFPFDSHDDVLINMPFSTLLQETRILKKLHRVTPFAFTFVFPVGAPSVTHSVHAQVCLILRSLGACRVKRWHTQKNHPANPVVFMGRKTTYIFPDSAAGFAPPLPLRWDVELWRYNSHIV